PPAPSAPATSPSSAPTPSAASRAAAGGDAAAAPTAREGAGVLRAEGAVEELEVRLAQEVQAEQRDSEHQRLGADLTDVGSQAGAGRPQAPQRRVAAAGAVGAAGEDRKS